MKPICSVHGCDRVSHSRGLCGTHYQRLRTSGSTRPEVPISVSRGLAWLRANCQPDHDECVLWPFTVNPSGYGNLGTRGTNVNAHAETCRIVHGPRPSVSHEAAHSCGNRACVNGKHLRWATAKENAADRLLHGTNLAGERANPAKLTDLQADMIRKDDRVQRTIAADYGVTQKVIHLIKSGKTYKPEARMS